ncbi:MAG: NUDIX domain-containing protein [Aureispira sp.]
MKVSSGIILFRTLGQQQEYLLLRPGGPFYKHQEEGIWTIPKGIVQPKEEELAAAKREFKEETGHTLQENPTHFTRLRWSQSKELTVYTLEGSLDPMTIVSNTFEMEYPKHSGVYQTFPEIERGAWFSLEAATLLVHPKLLPLLQALENNLSNYL